MKKRLNTYIFYVLGLIIAALGNTLMIKAALGQAPFNAMNYNISMVTGLKIGDIGILFNVLFMALQILILRRDFQWLQLLQLVPGFISGKFLNLFMYDLPVTAAIIPGSYPAALLVFLCGQCVSALGISLVTSADVIAFPCESLCKALTGKTKLSFRFYRTMCDVSFLAAALAIMLFIGNTNSIREGTVINMLLTGTLIDFLNRKLCEKYIYRTSVRPS